MLVPTQKSTHHILVPVTDSTGVGLGAPYTLVAGLTPLMIMKRGEGEGVTAGVHHSYHVSFVIVIVIIIIIIITTTITITTFITIPSASL